MQGLSRLLLLYGGKQGIEILKSSWPWYQTEIKDLNINNFPHEEINNFLYKKFSNKAVEINGALAFFSVVMPRKTFDKVGYLDEKYGVGLYEDDDYCRRIMSHGLKLLIALDVYVWHLASTTFKAIYLEGKINNLMVNNKNIFDDNWSNRR